MLASNSGSLSSIESGNFDYQNKDNFIKKFENIQNGAIDINQNSDDNKYPHQDRNDLNHSRNKFPRANNTDMVLLNKYVKLDN